MPSIDEKSVITDSQENLSHRPVAQNAEPAPESAHNYQDLEGLQDIGRASFGEPLVAGPNLIPAVPFNVLGPDNRERIGDTSAYPWRCHCFLLITAKDNSLWVGTGWFISPRTLATAGHCVYIHNKANPGANGRVKSIQVFPGRNGPALLPSFGGPIISTTFHAADDWITQGAESADYGAIVLPPGQNPGAQLGVLGFQSLPNGSGPFPGFTIAGYPADKPTASAWKHTGSILPGATPTLISYDMDTFGGQSGSAVFRMFSPTDARAVAIHAYGEQQFNFGVRITPKVFADLQSWMV